MVAQARAILLQKPTGQTFSSSPSKCKLRQHCNHERQARHLGGDQLRQDEVEEDGDAGEEPPALERNHRTGEAGHFVKPLPHVPTPAPSCTVHPLLPPALPSFHVTSF